MKKNEIIALGMGLHSPAQHALYYPGCDTTITDPSNSDCPDKEKGDIRGYAFIHQDFSFTDPSATAEWTSGIDSKEIFVFNLSRGSLEIAEVETAGFGDNDTTLDGFNFTANVFDPAYKANWGHYNTIKDSRAYKFAYKTETLIHLTDVTVAIIPKAPISEGEKSANVLWNIMVKWAQEDLPQPYDAPTGVFDQAIAV